MRPKAEWAIDSEAMNAFLERRNFEILARGRSEDGHPLQDNIDNRGNKITAVKNFTFFNLHSFSSVCNFFYATADVFPLVRFSPL